MLIFIQCSYELVIVNVIKLGIPENYFKFNYLYVNFMLSGLSVNGLDTLYMCDWVII